MDIAREHPDNLAARAKAEKYAKILAKTIVNPGGDDQDRGQNAFFYDAAEGLLTSVILLLAEYVPPNSAGHEKRHIVSVFKLVQELLAPSGQGKKTGFQVLMDNLPSTHKARWFAGAALNTSEQGMASVMSTVLSPIECFPRFRAGAGTLLRQCHRRRTLRRRESRDFSGAPGGRFNQKLYGRLDDPKPLAGAFSL